MPMSTRATASGFEMRMLFSAETGRSMTVVAASPSTSRARVTLFFFDAALAAVSCVVFVAFLFFARPEIAPGSLNSS